MELFSFPPYHVELTKGLLRVNVGEIAGTYDENAHRFGVKLFRDGAEENISGCTVSGYFIRPNGYTLTLHGTVENGVAWVTLNENCYYYDGAFTLAVKVTKVGIGTVLVVDGRIIQTRTDSIVDAENKIPSLEEIYASIDKTEQAIANANAAATKANAAAGRTPYIGANGHWYIWDGQSGEYVDSTNPSMPNPTFEVRTGEPGTQVQIAQSGTAENPIIILTIPRGDTGAVDGIDYFEGSPSALGPASPGTANGVARGNHVHPMPTAKDVGALPKDGKAEDASKLGGILADAYAQKAYANSNVYHLRGKLLNSGSDSVTAYGMATVLLMPGGVARIDFVAKVETAGNVNGNYAWGLNRDYFTALTGKTITPQAGGVLQCFNTNGNVWAERQDYGGTFINSGQFWCPARVYDTNGAIGGWGSNTFPAGTIFAGTCYGLYN